MFNEACKVISSNRSLYQHLVSPFLSYSFALYFSTFSSCSPFCQTDMACFWHERAVRPFWSSTGPVNRRRRHWLPETWTETQRNRQKDRPSNRFLGDGQSLHLLQVINCGRQPFSSSHKGFSQGEQRDMMKLKAIWPPTGADMMSVFYLRDVTKGIFSFTKEQVSWGYWKSIFPTC